MPFVVSSYDDVLGCVRLGTEGGEVTVRVPDRMVALALPPAQARSLAIQLWRLSRVAELDARVGLTTADDDGRLAGG
jgi:hypothetical protein